MADIFTKEKRSQVMSAIRSVGNKSTEMKLLRIFRANRISGWRRHAKLAGRPDFYFSQSRVAIFVDGCFWHGCPKCGHIPKSRSDFWRFKIERNKKRDLKNTRALKKAGVMVVRIWEHDLKGPRHTARILLRIHNKITRP